MDLEYNEHKQSHYYLKNVLSLPIMVFGSMAVVYSIASENFGIPIIGMLCFCLIPALIAFPVIIGKPKLLFIPYGILAPFLLIFISFIWFLPLCAGIGGFILRLADNIIGKTKRIIVTILAIILLTAPIMVFAEMFGGSAGAFFTDIRVREYVNENYPEKDFTVRYSHSYLYGNYYKWNVFYGSGKDDYFEIIVFRDDWIIEEQHERNCKCGVCRN